MDTITVSANKNPLDIYRATEERKWDILREDVELSFDLQRKTAKGKCEVHALPLSEAVDTIVLDGKGLVVDSITAFPRYRNKSFAFRNDGEHLYISIAKWFTIDEEIAFTVYYTADPYGQQSGGSAAIGDDRGLYFINTDHKVPNKPVQIWTQGESESNSHWYPTFDKPNERIRFSIRLNVPDSFQTLSNGVLVESKQMGNGIRQDYWRMDSLIQPYAVMFAIGKFSIIKDHWKDKEVNYYVEPDYAPYAANMFSRTPQMIDHFSTVTGVPYPWNKYSQVVVRDYVSGAMENTTASLFGEFTNKNNRELADYNNEDVVSHELFHQWFGDYVTPESWSNLTLSESFATYGEVIWRLHANGQASADELSYEDLDRYIKATERNDEPLVRYHYRDKEDMFDRISYQKGGAILHYMNGIMGDEAFSRAMQIYLTKNANSPAEASDWRKAVEEATGQDWNWFFDQWYYRGGHPRLSITYNYNDSMQLCRVTIQQKTSPDSNFRYRLPLRAMVFYGINGQETDWLIEKKKTTTIDVPYQHGHRPLIVPDNRHWLVGELSEKKTVDQWLEQMRVAGDYTSKRRAINGAYTYRTEPQALEVFKLAIDDSLGGIRKYALALLANEHRESWQTVLATQIKYIALNDGNNLVRAAAWYLLGTWKTDVSREDILSAINDSSYAVSGAALNALARTDSIAAYGLARQFLTSAQKPRAEQEQAAWQIVFKAGNKTDVDFLRKTAMQVYGNRKISFAYGLKIYAEAVDDEDTYHEAIKMLYDLAHSENIQGYRQAISFALLDIIKDYRATALPQIKARMEYAKTYAVSIINEEKDPDLKRIYQAALDGENP